MSKYALLFSKSGNIRFTSHLDLLRIFKRAFRRSGIAVSYSQGFNPHPRMSFCQPLSLGYEGLNEIIEFQTDSDKDRRNWLDDMQECLPDGIDLIRLGLVADGQRSLAGSVESADYDILFPVPYKLKDFTAELSSFMSQDTIYVEKRMKSGKTDKVDIKGKIRNISASEHDGKLVLSASLDSGSSSNLSPELLIKAFLSFTLPYTERYDIDVIRREMHFNVDCDISWM
ncbi:MAG: TIGR03936 family radical SAM-associated protein [Eubacterium sp.]|nr:TIGR03936 family radical SAM-associated protein [Eubacterium sp.]